MDKDEIDAMEEAHRQASWRKIEAHRQASWRHGFLCGFAWAALAVIIAAGICAVWTIGWENAKTDRVKLEKKK